MRFRNVVVSILAVGFLCFVVSAVHPIIGKQAISFTVEDQFGKQWLWEQYKGKNVLLLICDRKGRDYTDNWTKPLRATLGTQFEYVAIADVSSAPWILKSFIRNKIRGAIQQPLLLDWDGDIVEYYGCKEDVVNIIMVDKSNIVRFVTNGIGTPDEVKQATQELQKIIK